MKLKLLSIALAAGFISANVYAGSDQNDPGSDSARQCVAWIDAGSVDGAGWENFRIQWKDPGFDGKDCKKNGVRARFWKKTGNNGDSVTRCVGTNKFESSVIGFKPKKSTYWWDGDQDCK